jgi:predicted DNA-binding protein
MIREERFNLRLSVEEREKLRRLAAHFRRSESGAIRWLIHEAAERLDAARQPGS